MKVLFYEVIDSEGDVELYDLNSIIIELRRHGYSDTAVLVTIQTILEDGFVELKNGTQIEYWGDLNS